MKRPLLLLLTLCVATLWVPAMLRAAETPAAPRLDPQALDLLKRMSATLGAAKAFTYRSRSLVEVPATTGQFITMFSNAEVALQRPDKLSARLGGEAPHFDFFYDGSTVSAFAPGTNVYSVTKAPPTIDAMLPALEEETGIRIITAPLLSSDPYAAVAKGLTSAIVVGPATVGGEPCVHLAFRSPGVNWEIWITSGARALPMRLAVTFTDKPNFPRTLVQFSHWNLHPWLSARDFVFRKPAGAKEIPFLSVVKPKAR